MQHIRLHVGQFFQNKHAGPIKKTGNVFFWAHNTILNILRAFAKSLPKILANRKFFTFADGLLTRSEQSYGLPDAG